MEEPRPCSHSHSSDALGHVHAPATFGAAFAIGITLNGGFVLAEAFWGFRGNSMALLSDAGHNLGDVLGLLAAWSASVLSRRAPTATHTYGFRRSPVLAALFNGALLFLSTGAIVCESVRRLLTPQHVAADVVMVVAAVGIVINLGTALMFVSGSRDDLNLRAAFTHMLGDAAVAFGVVLAGLAIRLTHLPVIDPVVSIVVALMVAGASWKLLKEALNMALDGVPQSVSLKGVRSYLERLPGVSGVHDLHIWSMSTSETALTVHIVKEAGMTDLQLAEIADQLRLEFNVDHPTIQVEAGHDDVPCRTVCTGL